MCYCDIIRTVETVALGLLVLMHVRVCVTVFFVYFYLCIVLEVSSAVIRNVFSVFTCTF